MTKGDRVSVERMETVLHTPATHLVGFQQTADRSSRSAQCSVQHVYVFLLTVTHLLHAASDGCDACKGVCEEGVCEEGVCVRRECV